MSIQDEIYKRIKEEIELDPEKIGYAGKTDEEIKQLLNNPQTIITQIEQQRPSPMNRILSGLALAPNVITKTEEITNAKAFISNEEVKI